jgi:hypothetical protein
MKFEFVVDLKSAKQIALAIAPNVLARADRVIRWNARLRVEVSRQSMNRNIPALRLERRRRRSFFSCLESFAY